MEGKPDQGKGSSLTDQDKKMLERWTQMQMTTTPFVHPIRKHMRELIELKTQSVTVAPCLSVQKQNITTADTCPKAQVSH